MTVARLTRTLVLAGVVAAGATAAHPARASAGATPDFEIGTLTCRQFLHMEERQRTFTLAFYHGLINGIRRDLTFKGADVAKTTEGVIDTCIDGPDQAIFKVFLVTLRRHDQR